MAKKGRVSVSVLRELSHGDPDVQDDMTPHTLVKVESALQKADVFTKPLEGGGHWVNCWRCGMRPVPSGTVQSRS